MLVMLPEFFNKKPTLISIDEKNNAESFALTNFKSKKANKVAK